MQWKVFLALSGVIVVGVTLGGVLRPNSPTPTRLTLADKIALDSPQSGSGVRSLLQLFRLTADGGNTTQVGGWTGYVPLAGMSPQERRMICRELRQSRGPGPRVPLPTFCAKRHRRG